MTSPAPLGHVENPDELRRIWFNRYMSVQARADTRVRTILVQSAQDAQKRLSALKTNSTFSAGVRTAQIKMTMEVVKDIHKDIFSKMLPVIKNGQKDAAGAAFDAFAETDEEYLRAAFSITGDVANFVSSQRRASEVGVVQAINRLTHNDKPLSSRVYRSRAIANGWVQRIVTSSILRGDSAQDIAKAVRSHILPSVRGGTSYAAMRLGRTEINNAFHATTIDLTQDRPWVEHNRWNLSNTHVPQGCKCERYARIGLFPVDETPTKPHPQCRCYCTPELEPFETFVRKLQAGYYRDWTSRYAV